MYSQAEFELKNVPGIKDEFVSVVQRKQISSADDEIPECGDTHATSSLEPIFKRREDLCKHSV